MAVRFTGPLRRPLKKSKINLQESKIALSLQSKTETN